MIRNSGTAIELELSGLAEPEWLIGPGSAPLTVSFIAESVRFEGSQLQFLAAGAVVRTVPLDNVAGLTWRAAMTKGQVGSTHRNAGMSWSEEEREQLKAEVLGDIPWSEISHRHERSVTAVRAEAVRQRLVDDVGRRLDRRE